MWLSLQRTWSLWVHGDRGFHSSSVSRKRPPLCRVRASHHCFQDGSGQPKPRSSFPGAGPPENGARQGPYKERRGRRAREGDVMMEADFGVT